jgi:hypothetical protein
MHTEAQHIRTLAGILAGVYGREHATAVDREAALVIVDTISSSVGSPTLVASLREGLPAVAPKAMETVRMKGRLGISWATRLHRLAVMGWLVEILPAGDHFGQSQCPFAEFGWSKDCTWTMERALADTYRSMGEDTDALDAMISEYSCERPTAVIVALCDARNAALMARPD